MPDDTHQARLSQVAKYAAKYALDPALVCAVVEQESSWNAWAIRYEPMFYTRYIQPLINNGTVRDLTEATARSTSWGLMQTMGQVAREAGFAGRFLSNLCEPEVGLDVGCKVLQGKLAAAGGDVHAGLQRWNGGGNASYADEVLDRIRFYQGVSNVATS